MKKILLAAGLLFSGWMHAQIAITSDGQPITEGQVFSFNTTAESVAKLPLLVTNNTDELIFVKLRMDTMTNTSGASVQFCFGVCLYQVTAGLSVPPNFPIEIYPGESSLEDDHFWNANAGDGVNYPMQFNMTFIQTDENGALLQELRSFTYIYNPNLSVSTAEALEKMGIGVSQTLIENNVEIRTDGPAVMQLFSLSGQLLRTVRLQNSQSVDFSTLASGNYLLHFEKDGAAGNIRIIKK